MFMTLDTWITVLVFIIVYIFIAFEWLNKAVAAILGVMTLLILGVIDVHAVQPLILILKPLCCSSA